MTVRGTTVLASDPAAVRSALLDPDQLVAALPNVDAFGWLDEEDGTFSVVIRPALALGEVPFQTHWTPLPDAPDRARYHVSGRSGEHQIDIDVRLSLQPDAAGTRADWALDYTVRGTMRAVGQRVLDAIIAAQARAVLGAIALAAST